MYLLLASAYLCDDCFIPPLIPSSNINNILGSVSNSNSASVFFKQAFHVNPGADTK